MIKEILQLPLILIILFIASQPIIAQTKVQAPNWDICIYKPDPNPVKGFIPMSKVLKEKMNKRAKMPPCSTFDVTYIGFESFPAAQAAFQYAVDIWANSIASTITIKITATFEELGAGVLGSASASSYFINGDIPAGFAYPSVVADAVSDEDLDISESDINASFSNDLTKCFLSM